MQDADSPEVWSRFSECLGVTLWCSFIAAACETGLIFACFDPLTLGMTLGLDIYVSPSLMALRPMIYALGFFVFWLFTFVAAALTAYMLSTGPHADDAPRASTDEGAAAGSRPARSGS